MRELRDDDIIIYETEPKNICIKWIQITILTCVVGWIIISILSKIFMTASIYSYYYRGFSSCLLLEPGLILFFTGFIINELIYFYKVKKHGMIIILIIILIGTCGVNLKLIQYSDSYACFEDLHYVVNDTYYEDIETLKDIHMQSTTGKYASDTIYIDTSNFEFQVWDNIATSSNFNLFKSKFKNGEKVRIKYLPNSNELLSIEPVE